MNHPTSQILCVGSVAFDSITTPFGKVNKTLGGSAAYFSLAASLFKPTSIIAVVGSDFDSFGIFKKRHIDISGLEKIKGKTFHWAGKYHFDLNTRNTLKTELGVFAGFKPKLDERQKQAEYVFLGNIQPKLQLDVLMQIKRPQLIGLDTMDLWIETARTDLLKVMGQIDLLVINDSEARQLSKEHNLLKAAKKIFALMHKLDTFSWPRESVKSGPILIIKQDEHGLLLFHRQSSLRVQTRQSKNKIAAFPSVARNDIGIFNLPGYPLENVVDPTGAGDSFAGALMGYLAKTDDLSFNNLKKACAVASTVASFCVEEFGIKKLQTLTLPQVNKRLGEYKKLINF